MFVRNYRKISFNEITAYECKILDTWQTIIKTLRVTWICNQIDRTKAGRRDILQGNLFARCGTWKKRPNVSLRGRCHRWLCRVKEVKGVDKRIYVKYWLIIARRPRYHGLMTAGRFSRNGLRYTPAGNMNELIIDARCRRARRADEMLA